MPRPPKYAAKRDKAETPIVTALRQYGATITYLSAPNVPDLLVGFRGENYLLEVKTAKSKLKEGQKEWHLVWNGQVEIVRTPDEALKAIGIEVIE